MVLPEVVKGAAWLYVGAALNMFFGLLGILILPRLLDAENWGIFAATIAVTSFFASLFDAGLGYTTIHQTSTLAAKKKFERLKGILATLIKYRLIVIAISALIICIFADNVAQFFKAPGAGIYFRLSVAFFVIFNFSAILSCILTGLKWFREEMIVLVSNSFSRLLFSVAFVAIGFGINGAIVGYTIAIAIATAIQIAILRSFLGLRTKPLPAGAWRAGFFIGISSVAWTITVWTDSLMLGFFIGATAVGIYKIAMSIAGAAAGLIGTFNRAVFPIFAAAEARQKLSGEELGKIIHCSSLFAFPATVGLAIISGALINTFYSTEYVEATAPLAILSYLIIDSVIAGPISLFLAAKGRTKFIGILSSGCAALNVALNALLIPLFGLVGAAFASVATRLSYLVGVAKEARAKGAKIQLEHFLKPAVGSIVLFVALSFFIIPNLEFKLIVLDWTFWRAIVPILMAIAGGIVVYFCTMFMLGVNLLRYIFQGFEILKK